ncbi:MAG: lipopolysaccharide heptosyltransferase I [Burkholderiaceae bacterium]
MQSVLIVKTSSLGDIIHALPVVHDLTTAFPGIRIDWLVEEAYAELVALHPGVQRVVPVACRRWRRQGIGMLLTQWRQLRTSLRAQSYDAVLDLQGLLKSALLACAADGLRCGPSWQHTREPLATLAYAKRAGWDDSTHVVERLRTLTAGLLGYAWSGAPVFGLPPALGGPEQAVWLLHATARPEKSWPLASWQALTVRLLNAGYTVTLPWGEEAERVQAEAIAQRRSGVTVLPRMGLAELTAALGTARAAVGVDTGLTHLAGALQLPLLALYFATPAWRYGPKYDLRASSLGGDDRVPTVDEVWAALAGGVLDG